MDKLAGRKTLKVGNILDEFEKDRIKAEVDLVELFVSFGVVLERKGKGYMGKCPWHEDATPSLSVDREKGLYNCFGCGESGDAFSLVQKMKGADFKGALAFLKEYAGNGFSHSFEAKEPGEPEPEKEVPSSHTEKETTFSIELTLKAVCEYYQRTLAVTKEAMNYLGSRGFTNPSLLNRYGIGYAAGDLAGKVGSAQKKELTKIGIFTEKGHEAFAGCITVPLHSDSGQVVGLYGRKIAVGAKIKHLYLKGPHKGIFNRNAASAYREEIILTESVLDALSLLQLGIENVIPCYGTNGFTEEHRSLLKDERVKVVTIAFDNDDAGLAAAEKLKERLREDGFGVKEVYPPVGKDWNEYRVAGGTKEELRERFSSAEATSPQGRGKDFSVTRENGKYRIQTSALTYTVLGVKEGFTSSLKVNIRAEKEGARFIDNVDLFSARSRQAFSHALSRILDLETARVETDLVQLLDYLEEEQEKEVSASTGAEVPLTEDEKELGMELLTSPDLFDRIVRDTTTLGYVGENINKLLIYIAASSRKLFDPISVMVVSQSASGKSYLIDTVKKLIPEDEVVSLTSLSDQALNYLPDGGLVHKFLVMGEAVHSEVVEHQMREILSAGELSRLVTTKDEKTGKMVSMTVRSKAVVSAVMSSTSLEINHENLSRFFVVNTDESPEQTRRIHEAQRRKYTISRYREKETKVPEIIKAHRAAQRLLERRIIVNPFAEKLNFPATLMRSRRDHERFIDLIACVCHLRQFQKEVREAEGLTFIECDLTDYEIAYRIMQGVLPMTLSNVPQTALSLYEELRILARKKGKEEDLRPEDVGFTQREVREHSQLGQRTIKKYMQLLVEYEYLKAAGLRTRGSRNTYSLVRDEDLRLVDVSSIPSPETIQAECKKL